MKHEIGIWTPWASVLCTECHGLIKHSGVKKEIEFREADLQDGYALTTCNACDKAIQVYDEVALENNLCNEIKDVGIKCEMMQTGGMNSACFITAEYGANITGVTKEDEEDEMGYYITYNMNCDGMYVIASVGYDGEPFDDVFEEFEVMQDMLNFVQTLESVVTY